MIFEKKAFFVCLFFVDIILNTWGKKLVPSG
ncbi:MAG: hypothetical protein RLZZ292_2841 [Bacteroidota bacterium]|jgi:hypothetical protein